MRAALDEQRARVAAEFDALLAPRRKAQAPDALASYWRALPDAGDAGELSGAGFVEAAQADGLLRDLARSPGVKGLSDSARARLDRVLPALLQAAAGSQQPMLALRRLLALLQNILRRSAYLALLDEQPAALQRLVDVVSHSALLAERLAAYPLLLDELLDARVAGSLPDREALLAACAAVAGDGDTEAVLQELNEVRQALSFRIAMAVRDRRQSAVDSAQQLAWLADGVVARVLALAQHEVAGAHGTVEGARFAVLGYGSLGGEELGFGSDLDLVFLYDAAPDAQSDGARPLDATRWFARLAQKIVALLGAVTAAGRLFDVDVRLRPDGAKGLLVSSLASFGDYQRERAWTWEHQALVRARFIAGDEALGADFERVRAETLTRLRDSAQIRDGCRRHAAAHARGTRPQRRGSFRPEAGRGRAGRPGVPAAGAGADQGAKPKRTARAAEHAGAGDRDARRRALRCRYRGDAAGRACDPACAWAGLHIGPPAAAAAARRHAGSCTCGHPQGDAGQGLRLRVRRPTGPGGPALRPPRARSRAMQSPGTVAGHRRNCVRGRGQAGCRRSAAVVR